MKTKMEVGDNNIAFIFLIFEREKGQQTRAFDLIINIIFSCAKQVQLLISFLTHTNEEGM